MEARTRKWGAVLVAFGLLFLWELSYRAGVVDLTRFSHPIAIFEILADSKFLVGFSIMLLQLAFVSLFGVVGGSLLGMLVIHSGWLNQAMIRFSRMALWVPLLITWAIPIWPPKEGYWLEPIFWSWAACVLAVMFAACYHYLTVRSVLDLEWREGRQWIMRNSILHALLVTLISQIWIKPYGWKWYYIVVPGGIEAAYVTLVFLVVSLWLLDLVFCFRFEDVAAVRGRILLRDVTSETWRSVWGCVELVVLCLVSWQLLSLIGFYPLISSPAEVLNEGYRMFTTATSNPQNQRTTWEHLGVSLGEVLVGLVLGAGLALSVIRLCAVSAGFQTRVLSLLPLTNVVPILFPLFLIQWFRVLGSLPTISGVAFLTFFPCIQVIWATRDRPPLFRVLLALDDALPFAFVAMFFGEAMSAFSGLGLFVSVALATGQVSKGLAAALITVGILVILSSILRWTASRVYFPPALAASSSEAPPLFRS